MVLWHHTIQKSFELDKKFSKTKPHLKVIKDEQGVYRVSCRLDNAPIPFLNKIFCALTEKTLFYITGHFRKNHILVDHNGTNKTYTNTNRVFDF